MKYKPYIIKVFLKALEEGSGRVRACKAASIEYQTFINWMNDPRKLEFFEAVKKAESIGEDKIADICKRRIIEDPSWQSGAWWLERTQPDKYRNRTDINFSTSKKSVDELFPDENELSGTEDK